MYLQRNIFPVKAIFHLMPLSHGPLFAQFMPIIDVSKIQNTHNSKMHCCNCTKFCRKNLNIENSLNTN